MTHSFPCTVLLIVALLLLVPTCAAADVKYELIDQTGHAAWLVGMSLSGDSRRLLTTDLSDTAILWDTATGDKLRTFHGRAAELSSDGCKVMALGYEVPSTPLYPWPQDWTGFRAQ